MRVVIQSRGELPLSTHSIFDDCGPSTTIMLGNVGTGKVLGSGLGGSYSESGPHGGDVLHQA